MSNRDLTPYLNCNAYKNNMFISSMTEEKFRAAPCCRTPIYIETTSYSDFKEQLVKTSIEDMCSFCIQSDDAGAISRHQIYKDLQDELAIEIRIDTLCNLKCMTCHPANSSALISEWTTLNKFSPEIKKQFCIVESRRGPKTAVRCEELVDDVIREVSNNFSSIRIGLLGGEPLFSPSTVSYIQTLSTKPYANKINLHIHNNGTKSFQFIESEFRQFNSVRINFSIDGIDEVYELLRYGAEFKTACANIDYAASLAGNVHVQIMYTSSLLNAFSFVEFVNWATTNYPTIKLLFVRVSYPRYYSVRNLPLAVRQVLLTKTFDLELTPTTESLITEYRSSLREVNLSDTDEIRDARLAKCAKTIRESCQYRNADTKPIQQLLSFIDQHLLANK